MGNKLEKTACAIAATSFWVATFSPFVCSYLDRPDLSIPSLMGGYLLCGIAALVEAGETQKRIYSNSVYTQ